MHCPEGGTGPCLGVGLFSADKATDCAQHSALDSGCRQVRVCPMASGYGLPHTHTYTYSVPSSIKRACWELDRCAKHCSTYRVGICQLEVAERSSNWFMVSGIYTCMSKKCL